MLQAVSSEYNSLRIGSDSYSVLAYADDVTLFSNTLSGLQNSINKIICTDDSKLWGFKFNPLKPKFIVIGPKLYCNPSDIQLDGKLMNE